MKVAYLPMIAESAHLNLVKALAKGINKGDVSSLWTHIHISPMSTPPTPPTPPLDLTNIQGDIL